MSDIVIVNQSALLTPTDITPVVAALNKQIAGDFAPAWGTPGTVYFGTGPAGAWQFFLRDTIDEQNDLGYHVDDNGVVSAIIDILACRNSNTDWRGCVSHEVLEALADPTTMRMAPNGVDIVEVCDPCELDTYQIDGVTVSNFVTPAYFGFNTDTRYDHLGWVTGAAPTLRPGGYVLQYDPLAKTWHTVYGEHAQGGFMVSRKSGRRTWRQSKHKVDC